VELVVSALPVELGVGREDLVAQTGEVPGIDAARVARLELMDLLDRDEIDTR